MDGRDRIARPAPQPGRRDDRSELEAVETRVAARGGERRHIVRSEALEPHRGQREWR
jgi:hypothetical protein